MAMGLEVRGERLEVRGERLEVRGERREAKGFVDPYSANYDASMIWAPIHGWKMYIGFRWALTVDK